MESSKADRSLDLPGPAAAWALFLITAGVLVLWLAVGVYVVGMGIAILDPIFLLAFGLVSALMISHRRPGLRFGLSVRGSVALVAFMAALIFVSTRPLVGLGNDSDLSHFVTILDADSGRPVEGAFVTAFDGHNELASEVTDGRGRATLEYGIRMDIAYSWLLSRRTIKPGLVAIEARAESYPLQRRVLRHATDYRFRPVEGDFERYQQQFAMESEIVIRK